MRHHIMHQVSDESKRLRAERNRRYRESHKEAIAEHNKRYYWEHKGLPKAPRELTAEEVIRRQKKAEYRRQYYQAHKEEMKAYSQAKYRRLRELADIGLQATARETASSSVDCNWYDHILIGVGK